MAQGSRPFSLPGARDAAAFYASFWRRVGASFIDFLIMSVPFIAVTWALDNLLASVLTSLATIAYQVAFLVTRGATPGRRLLGIRVITASGANPDPPQALIRQIFTVLFLLSTFADEGPINPEAIFLVIFAADIVDVLWMLRDERYQTLHDRLAGTFVARTSAMST